jgi:hypothetical protein
MVAAVIMVATVKIAVAAGGRHASIEATADGENTVPLVESPGWPVRWRSRATTVDRTSSCVTAAWPLAPARG